MSAGGSWRGCGTSARWSGWRSDQCSAGQAGLASGWCFGTSTLNALAFDPAAFAVGAPDMGSLLTASRASVILAAGEHDHMCTADQLCKVIPDPVILPGLGHNAHVEAPDALWPLLERLAPSR